MMGLLDRYAVRKRKRQVISNSESDPTPVHTAELSLPATDGQPVTDGSSGDQAIIIPCSPELEPTGGAELDGAGQSKSNDGDPTPRALQVIPPLDRGDEQPAIVGDNPKLPSSPQAGAPESGGIGPWGGGGERNIAPLGALSSWSVRGRSAR